MTPSNPALRRAARELRRVARDTALESAMCQVPRTTSSMAPDPWHVEPSWMRRRAQEHDELLAVAEWLEGMAEEKR